MQTLKYFYFPKFHLAMLQHYQFTGNWVFFLERPSYLKIWEKFWDLSGIFLSFKETLLKIWQQFSEISRCEILNKFQENYEKIL